MIIAQKNEGTKVRFSFGFGTGSTLKLYSIPPTVHVLFHHRLFNWSNPHVSRLRVFPGSLQLSPKPKHSSRLEKYIKRNKANMHDPPRNTVIQVASAIQSDLTRIAPFQRANKLSVWPSPKPFVSPRDRPAPSVSVNPNGGRVPTRPPLSPRKISSRSPGSSQNLGRRMIYFSLPFAFQPYPSSARIHPPGKAVRRPTAAVSLSTRLLPLGHLYSVVPLLWITLDEASFIVATRAAKARGVAMLRWVKHNPLQRKQCNLT